MKKENQYKDSINKDFERNKGLEIDKIKTTNVNILLNRVRLDKKNAVKKNILITLLVVSLVCAITIFLII